MKSGFLIYGANGYTGRLVARLAVGRGLRPLLAGRHPEDVGALARELGLEHRVFSLDDAEMPDATLAGVAAVLHCAGPFSRTSRPMADSCLRTRTHYLDITGEIAVFEALAARDAEAKAAGITLLPGVGFDVVPSDCLAAHLKRRLPSATKLTLAIKGTGRISHGTATTMVENIAGGGFVRRSGRLTPVPAAWKTRLVDYGHGPEKATTIPWGDISTAFHSTGIPNIEVYAAMPASARRMMKASRLFGRLFAGPGAQRFLKSRIKAQPAGPSDEERARGKSFVWGEVTDDAGARSSALLRGPEGYKLTSMTALAAIGRVLDGQAPTGFQTPSKAFGADFVLEIDGVERKDLD
jgi:short subunit dehydrogenase-like uncharacterized protein